MNIPLKVGYTYISRIGVFFVLLMTVYMLNESYAIWFYFDASWSWHKQVFPTFYPVVFLFFRTLIPTVVTICIWRVTSYRFEMRQYSGFVFIYALVFMGTIFLFELWGFSKALPLFLTAFILASLWWLFYTYKYFLIAFLVRLTNNISSVIFFFLYLLVCLVLNTNFCPFYRFDMFANMSASNASVIVLKDCNDSMVVYQSQFNINEGELFNIYMRTNAVDSIAAQFMVDRMVKSKIADLPLACDSLSIYKLNIILRRHKIFLNEHILSKNAY